MRSAPLFWWQTKPNWAAWLLAPIGAIYGAITAHRMARANGLHVGIPVICVGNFIAGGAGKTPVAIALAELFIAHNLKPVFLTRGYGARQKSKPHRVDLDCDQANDVGDEALLLARTAPVIVSADRIAGSYAAVAEGADVIVMDDGLQNPTLTKTRSLAVVDGASGVGNGLCVPAGPLRAPLGAQWPHVSGVVLVGSGTAGEDVAQQAQRQNVPLLRAKLEPSASVVARLRGQSVIAFAGIGRPAKFFNTLSACGVRVIEAHGFSDHHAYTETEIQFLLNLARDEAVSYVVTTEKDLVRIPQALRRTSGVEIIALPVAIVFDDPDQVTNFFRLA